MLRRILLYLSAARWARSIISGFWLARRVARRFVAGETLDEAIRVTRDLNNNGMLVTLDYLGESVTSAADTETVVAMYRAMLARIRQDGLKSGISLKLTHLGLDISEDLCVTNLRHILTAARDSGNIPVTIDMESSKYTETTLRIYRTLRDEYGFQNVGTVIQSYLRRSEADMGDLTRENAHVRLCKGAYLEPATVAFPEKADVDASYTRLVEQYLSAPTQSFLAIATHDENMIVAAQRAVKQHGIAPTRYEFQMLFGIRTARQAELATGGYAMRVYVPFGEAWYPYFMRRLAERPANLLFFVRSLFQR